MSYLLIIKWNNTVVNPALSLLMVSSCCTTFLHIDLILPPPANCSIATSVAACSFLSIATTSNRFGWAFLETLSNSYATLPNDCWCAALHGRSSSRYVEGSCHPTRLIQSMRWNHLLLEYLEHQPWLHSKLHERKQELRQVERGFQWRKTWQFWMDMLRAKLNQCIIVDWWDQYDVFSGSLPEVAPDLFHTGVSFIHYMAVTIGLLKEFISLSCYSCRAWLLGASPINSAIIHLSVDYKVP